MGKQTYKQILKAWRTHSFLKAKNPLTDAQRRKLESLSTLELAAATRNGDHTLIGREAAQTLLRQRGGRLVAADVAVPGFVKPASVDQLRKRFFGKMRQLRRISGWLVFLFFAAVIVAAGYSVETENGVLRDGVEAGLFNESDIRGSARNLTDEEIAEAPKDALETFTHETSVRDVLLYKAKDTPAGKRRMLAEKIGISLVGFTSLSFLVWFVATVFRGQPARVLLLRKFNDKKVSKSLERVISDQLRVFGHVVTLSDKHVRRSRFAMIWNAIPTNFAHAALVVIWFPIRLVLRQFNRAKYGPVWVGSARNYRALANRLRDKWALNLEVAWARKEAFIIRTHDKWWQEVVALVMESADVIVTDLSNVTAGTQWELDRLHETGRLQDAIFIAHKDAQASARLALNKFPNPLHRRVYFYDNLGEFEGDGQEIFREDMLRQIGKSSMPDMSLIN